MVHKLKCGYRLPSVEILDCILRFCPRYGKCAMHAEDLTSKLRAR